MSGNEASTSLDDRKITAFMALVGLLGQLEWTCLTDISSKESETSRLHRLCQKVAQTKSQDLWAMRPELKTNAVMITAEVKRIHEFRYLENDGDHLCIIAAKNKFRPKTSQTSTSVVHNIKRILDPRKDHVNNELKMLLIFYSGVSLTDRKNLLEDLSKLLVRYNYRYNTIPTTLFTEACNFVSETFTIDLSSKPFLMEPTLKRFLQKTQTLLVACQHLHAEETLAEFYLKRVKAAIAKSPCYLQSYLCNLERSRTQYVPQMISFPHASTSLENAWFSLKQCEKKEQNAIDTLSLYMKNRPFPDISKITLILIGPAHVNNSSTSTDRKFLHLEEGETSSRKWLKLTIMHEDTSLMTVDESSSYWDKTADLLANVILTSDIGVKSIQIDDSADVWLPLLHEEMLDGSLSDIFVDTIECKLTLKKKHLMPLLLDLTEEKNKIGKIILSLEEVAPSKILDMSYLCSECCKWMNCNEIIERQLEDLRMTANQSGIKLTVRRA